MRTLQVPGNFNNLDRITSQRGFQWGNKAV
jgi:hypothetical protein